MSDIKGETVIMWALILGGAYLLYRALSGVSNAVGAGVSAATNQVSCALAKSYLALTAPGGITTTGNVVLPNGSTVPLSSLPGLVPDANGDVYATIGGQQYQIQPSTSCGNYPAVAVSSCCMF